MRGFSVSTRCETVEEFIATFRDRCDEKSIVVNVVEPRVVGTECAFAILLANKKPVLAGTCVVLDVFHDANNAFKRRGMRLGINRLGVESERVFSDLTAARMVAKRSPPARATPRAPTMAMPIVSADVVLTETRTPGSKYVLPANPLMNIPDASLEGFVECHWGDESVPDEIPVAARLARGTIDEPVNEIVEDGPTSPIEMPVRVARELRHDDLGALADEVTPLPPPPVVEPTSAVIEAAPAIESPRARRRVRPWMALAAIPVVAAIVAAIVLANAQDPLPAAATRIEPAFSTSAEDINVRGTVRIEAAPAPVAAPVKLAKRFPIVKRVKPQVRATAKKPTAKPAGAMNLSDL